MTLEGHKEDVMSATLSPDGEHVVAASSDRSAKIWSANSGECKLTLEGHGDRLNSAAYDLAAKIWSAASRECILTLEGHGGVLEFCSVPVGW